MHSIFFPALSRRELIRAGGLSLLGLTSAQLATLRKAQAVSPSTAKHQQNSCVFLFLFGGPSQIDLWDMKPDASVEIRGDFRPVSSRVPGIQLCEHLPGLTAQMDKVCLVRSMQHEMNVHGPACSEIFSGRPYHSAPITDQATPDDWPSVSAMTMRYGRSGTGMPPSVVLPWYLHFTGQSRRIAGQTGGRMGDQYNAMLIEGKTQGGFQVDGLKLDVNLPFERITERRRLLNQLQTGQSDQPFSKEVTGRFDRHREQAVSLLKHRAGDVLDLERESTKTREAYGKTTVGQSLLMARRLVEAGVSLVTVNWEDETKISDSNTCWDTHENNFSKLKDLLCPIFDQAFPAFLQDLDDRGLLETTLVVAVGEFGRTPRLGQFTQSSNTKKTGRDHWPHAFTAILAGGGVPAGHAYGATDHHAGYVVDKPVSPADLAATIFRHLGIEYETHYESETQKLQHALSSGHPIRW